MSSSEQKKANALWDNARNFEDAGELEKALALREELFSQLPDSKKAMLPLADLYQKLGHLVEAEKLYQKIIKLYPKWELGSKFLFHFLWDDDCALWAVGRRDEAIEEIARFQSIAHCDDYMKIIREINEKYSETCDDN